MFYAQFSQLCCTVHRLCFISVFTFFLLSWSLQCPRFSIFWLYSNVRHYSQLHHPTTKENVKCTEMKWKNSITVRRKSVFPRLKVESNSTGSLTRDITLQPTTRNWLSFHKKNNRNHGKGEWRSINMKFSTSTYFCHTCRQPRLQPGDPEYSLHTEPTGILQSAYQDKIPARNSIYAHAQDFAVTGCYYPSWKHLFHNHWTNSIQ
jgi:hypothetical protein